MSTDVHAREGIVTEAADSVGPSFLQDAGGFCRVGERILILRHVDDMSLFKDFEIRRCDDRGCTLVTVSRSNSGIFTELGQRGGTYFLRVQPFDPWPGGGEEGRGAFMEVAPSLMSVYAYYGRCPALVEERP